MPLVGITSGRCFAGNAALLGCCDVIIATANSNIGMGGPAMIEGGGLGVFRPEEVGPMSVQVPNGVVDIAGRRTRPRRCASREAVPLLLPGPGDGLELRRPARCCAASCRRTACASTTCAQVIETLADTGSVLELRPRLRPRHDHRASSASRAGRSASIANNPTHLGGAIDSDGRRQGRALHAALRRLRHPAALPVRHAGHHGRAGSGEDRRWCAMLPRCS